MNRRDTVLGLLALGAAPLATNAQQPKKIPRLCFLSFGPDTLRSNRFGAFFDGLRQLGYIDGQTIAIDYLSADGRGEQFSALAAECLRLKADIIVVSTTPAAQAAKKATRTIPIVMLALADPVGSGVIDSLSRPGGNVTGMTFMARAFAAKRLQLLKELAPRISRVLVLAYTVDPIDAPQIEAMKSAARSLGVTLQIQDIRTAGDLPAAFEAGAKAHVEGLVTTTETIFATNYARVVELAAQYRLPAVYTSTASVPNGGLMAYIADFPALYVSAASYIDKILKGAKPADLPAEQPTKFRFLINLKTAKALGIIIPPSLLALADEVIQ